MRLTQQYIESMNNFKTECTDLIDKFKSKGCLDFKTFSTIWIKFKFNVIYEKYIDCHDYTEFKEDSLQIAKSIMLNDHFVGGLYLLFGLYYVQGDPRSNIRLELGELEKILSKINEDRGNFIETCQPGLLVAKLLKNDAFSFVVFSKEFSIEGRKRASLVFSKQKFTDEDENSKVEEWLKTMMGKTNIFEELSKADQEYAEMKARIKEKHPELNLSLNMTTKDFTSGLADCLLNNVFSNSAQIPSNFNWNSISNGNVESNAENKDSNFKHIECAGLDNPGICSSNLSDKKKSNKVLYFKKMMNKSESEVNFSSEDVVCFSTYSNRS